MFPSQDIHDGFALRDLISDLHLDFYGQVKLINYIRTKVFEVELRLRELKRSLSHNKHPPRCAHTSASVATAALKTSECRERQAACGLSLLLPVTCLPPLSPSFSPTLLPSPELLSHMHEAGHFAAPSRERFFDDPHLFFPVLDTDPLLCMLDGVPDVPSEQAEEN